eukprot:5859605-Pleurochrysis_carterae.AAC.7
MHAEEAHLGADLAERPVEHKVRLQQGSQRQSPLLAPLSNRLRETIVPERPWRAGVCGAWRKPERPWRAGVCGAGRGRERPWRAGVCGARLTSVSSGVMRSGMETSPMAVGSQSACATKQEHQHVRKSRDDRTTLVGDWAYERKEQRRKRVHARPAARSQHVTESCN